MVWPLAAPDTIAPVAFWDDLTAEERVVMITAIEETYLTQVIGDFLGHAEHGGQSAPCRPARRSAANEPGVGADWPKQQPDNRDKEQHGHSRRLPRELQVRWPLHEGVISEPSGRRRPERLNEDCGNRR